MPSPWLLARKNGLYCRVFIPTDLRPVLGQRYLVRSLAVWDKDRARLIASQYAMALSELFRQLRKEMHMPEPKVSDIIQTIKSGGTRDYTIRHTDPLTGRTSELDIRSDRDEKLARKHVPHFFESPPAPALVPLLAASPNAAALHGVFRLSPEHAVPLSGRIAAFKKRLTDKNRTAKYIDECLRALDILKDIAGDLPPDDYTPTLIDEFMTRIKWLPRNPEKDPKNRDLWKEMSYREMTNHVELLGLPNISDSTVNKHVIRLSVFFSFCKDRRYMSLGNPFSEQTVKDEGTKGSTSTAKAERMPFEKEELERIFDSELYKTRKVPHAFWPPLIALMTGARVNEIAQLYVDDIVNDIEDMSDAWRIMIVAKRPDQRVKNKSSLRSIPVHPKLIELGFLQYVEDMRRLKYKRVFPSLLYKEASGYGDTVSEFFLAYLRNKVKIDDPLKVFHSFRHWFCHHLFNSSGKERMQVVAITGHAREGTFERTYAHKLYYAEQIKLLNTLPLPELNIKPYQKGDYDVYYRKFFKNRAARLRLEKAKAEEKAKEEQAKLEQAKIQQVVSS